MNTSASGIVLARLVDQNGWQMALEIMRLHNHPSHIWDWAPSLQLMEYTAARKYLNSICV